MTSFHLNRVAVNVLWSDPVQCGCDQSDKTAGSTSLWLVAATANRVTSYHRWVQMKWGSWNKVRRDETRWGIWTLLNSLRLVINQLCQPQRIACWTVPHPINWPVQEFRGTLHNTSSAMPVDQCYQHLSLYRHQRLLSQVSQQKAAAA